MVLDLYMGIFFLYICNQQSEEGRAADSCHVLEADLVGSVFDDLVNDPHIVLDRMDRGVGNRKGDLRDHPGFLCILDGTTEIAVVVESAE